MYLFSCTGYRVKGGHGSITWEESEKMSVQSERLIGRIIHNLKLFLLIKIDILDGICVQG